MALADSVGSTLGLYLFLLRNFSELAYLEPTKPHPEAAIAVPRHFFEGYDPDRLPTDREIKAAALLIPTVFLLLVLVLQLGRHRPTPAEQQADCDAYRRRIMLEAGCFSIGEVGSNNREYYLKSRAPDAAAARLNFGYMGFRLHDLAQPGDSVIKRAGESYFLLIKPNGRHYRFEVDCDAANQEERYRMGGFTDYLPLMTYDTINHVWIRAKRTNY